jgi:hypothetical protein
MVDLFKRREQIREANKRWKENNREKARMASRRWKENNQNKISEYMLQWREANAASLRNVSRSRYQKDRLTLLTLTVKTRAHAPEAVPVWLTKEQWQEIAAFYELAQQTTIATGVLHVVDHIWPLKGKNSCGLHVPWNLQVITHARNVAKGSREPEE